MEEKENESTADSPLRAGDSQEPEAPTTAGPTEPVVADAQSPVESPLADEPKEKKKFSFLEHKVFIAFLIILALITTGALVYLYIQNQNLKKEMSQSALTPTPTTFPDTPTPTPDPTADWETFTNLVYYYSIQFPDKYSIVSQTDRQIGQLGEGNNICIEDSNGTCTIVINAFTTANTLDEFKQWAKSGLTKSDATELEGATGGFFNSYPALFVGDNKIYVQINTGIFQIAWIKDAPEIDQILSTFKLSIPTKINVVKLYYYNQSLDPKIDCLDEAVVPVERQVNFSPENKIEKTIKLLLEGKLSDTEKQQGFSTEFPKKGFELLSSTLENGLLTLQFPVIYGFTTGGSCRVGLLNTEVRKTALQFPEVKEVRYEPEDIFSP